MKNKLIPGIMTLTVLTVLIAGVVVPTIGYAENDLYTDYDNLSSKWTLEEFGTDTEHTIILADGTYLIDGEPYDYGESRFSYLVASDNFTIKNSASNGVSFVTISGQSGTTYTSSDSILIEISNGTITYSAGEVSKVATYTWVMIPSHDGDFVIMDSSDIVYLSSLNDITCVEGHGSVFYSVHNGVIVPYGGVLTATTESVLDSDGAVISAEDVKVNGVSMDYIIVPDEVRFISSTNSGIIPLLAVIPVLVIIGGLLMVAVRMITKQN